MKRLVLLTKNFLNWSLRCIRFWYVIGYRIKNHRVETKMLLQEKTIVYAKMFYWVINNWVIQWTKPKVKISLLYLDDKIYSLNTGYDGLALGYKNWLWSKSYCNNYLEQLVGQAIEVSF